MSNEAQALWYVVHTYSGYENKVAENIERLVEYRGLQNLIFETRIPTEIVVDSQEEADEYLDSLEVEYDDDGNEVKKAPKEKKEQKPQQPKEPKEPKPQQPKEEAGEEAAKKNHRRRPNHRRRKPKANPEG